LVRVNRRKNEGSWVEWKRGGIFLVKGIDFDDEASDFIADAPSDFPPDYDCIQCHSHTFTPSHSPYPPSL
jgi:hypothetical protein